MSKPKRSKFKVQFTEAKRTSVDWVPYYRQVHGLVEGEQVYLVNDTHYDDDRFRKGLNVSLRHHFGEQLDKAGYRFSVLRPIPGTTNAGYSAVVFLVSLEE